MGFDTNTQAAMKVTEFLRRNMLETQRMILQRKQKAVSEQECKQFMEFDEIVNSIRKESEEIRNLGGVRYCGFGELMVEARKFKRLHREGVIISEEKIDELMELVYESIDRNGFGEQCFSLHENFLLRKALEKIANSKYRGSEIGEASVNDEGYTKIVNWLIFLHIWDYIGVDIDISGRITWNSAKREFYIFNDDGTTFYHSNITR